MGLSDKLELIEKIKTYIELYELPPFGCEVEGTVELLREILDRITEYEKLEKQGRLIKLPCKIGDTLYAYCEMIGDVLHYTVHQATVNWDYSDKESYYVLEAIASNNGEILGVIDVGQDDIGETVFLTEEEAVKKMEEKLC